MKKLLISLMAISLLIFSTVGAVSAEPNEPKAEQKKELKVSKDDKIIGGVCGGIAEYFGWDPTIVRIGWVILDFVYGIGIIAYAVAWVLMS